MATDPRHPPRPTAPRRRARHAPGAQPAGRILATMTAALVLAALINADAMVERAEHKPLGPGRDRSLALWHPLQDVAGVTQISRLRDLGDWLVGNEDQGADVVPDVAGPTTTVPPAVTRPTVRVPAATDPLRVYVGGDSIVRDAGDALLQLAADDPVVDITLHYENASGLTRPDFYDWPAALAADMAAHRPEVVFLLFGGNDSQGLVAPDGQVHSGPAEPGWRDEYARRVGDVMDLLRSEDRIVVWIGLPPMREAGFDGRAQVMNAIYRDEAAGRPWMTYLDTRPIFGADDGSYVPRKADEDGDLVDLRQDDGVHLSSPGARRLARVLLAIVAEEIRGPSATTTTTTADDR